MKHITILFYNTMWGMPLPFMDEPLPSGFTITTDRSWMSEADAVVFHIPDLYNAMGEEEIVKPDNQIWVGWSLECEENYPILKQSDFRNMFDVWMGYHQSDDVIYPYYMNFDNYMRQYSFVDFDKRKDVCMFISSNINKSHRVEYVSELMRHIHIDSYGKLFKNQNIEHDCGRKTAIEIMRNYKFVIAFENAVADDYVTEKFYNPIYAGSVPIYIGAPNVADFSPYRNCYVDVRDFSSPYELSVYLKACVSSSLKWKQSFGNRGEVNHVFQKKLSEMRENPFIRLSYMIRTRLKRHLV